MWNFLDWIWRKAQLVDFNRKMKSLNIRKENINSRAIFWFHKSLEFGQNYKTSIRCYPHGILMIYELQPIHRVHEISEWDQFFYNRKKASPLIWICSIESYKPWPITIFGVWTFVLVHYCVRNSMTLLKQRWIKKKLLLALSMLPMQPNPRKSKCKRYV